MLYLRLAGGAVMRESSVWLWPLVVALPIPTLPDKLMPMPEVLVLTFEVPL